MTRRPRLRPGTARLLKPAILGGFDGTASLLGVIVFLAFSHPRLVFPAALSGALSAAVSMGGGQWLSDSTSGPGAAVVMGAATFAGALLPAVPFAVTAGPAAVAASAVLCCLVAVAVAGMRAAREPGGHAPDGTRRDLGVALAETFGILAAVAAVTVALGLVLPGGAG